MKKFLKELPGTILWSMFFIALLLFLMTFTGLNNFLVTPLVKNEAPQKADVIIVLGGGVVTDLKILPWAVQERVQKGIELKRKGYAEKIIVTGGLVKHQTYTESQIMKEYTDFLGVESNDVIEENQAEDTHENAEFSKQIMEQNGWKTALLVTSDFHSARACKVFRKVGVSVTCLAVPPASGYEHNYFRKLTDGISIFRDYGAVLYYWMRGYI